MSDAPFLVLRDFRVWFAKRSGLLASLRKAEPQYVRAVDGVDLDIRRGEVYCLVGESGCGKTTTGKGILRLVEPTGGDVFVGLTQDEHARYEAARNSKDEATLEDVRRRHSLTYREAVKRTTWDLIGNVLLALGAMGAAILVTAGLVLVGGGPFAGLGVVPAFLVTALVLGSVATLPRVKLTKRIPTLLMPLGLLAAILALLLSLSFERVMKGEPADLGSIGADFILLWERGTILSTFLDCAIAPLATWYVARVSMGFWRRRQGFEADRIRKLRKTLQIVFQDPYESLNPKHSVYDTVAEPLIVNRLTRSRSETEARVEQALNDAGLRPPRDFMFRYPHELSGGQRQRVSIAGALVLDPDFLVADEPVSMLDVSIRTEIIELLLDLRKQKSLTYLFITHDLSLAWVLADRIGVMYLGKIVEEGTTEELIRNPRHPYTKALISVVPVPDPDRRRQRIILKGERPDPVNLPAGCRFHPRCPVAFERCGWTSDEVLEELREIAGPDAEADKWLQGAKEVDPGSFTLADGSVAAEGWIRSHIAGQADTRRALKAIRGIERFDGGLRVTLFPTEEPTLRPVGADTKVSCHLFP